MLRRNIVWVSLFIASFCNAQHIRVKMIHMQSPAVGRYRLYIIPNLYDSTVTPEQMARCIDSLPGHLFNAKMYNLLYKDDTTKLAVKMEEGSYLFHLRFTSTIYWKNGDKKSLTYINRHFEKYWEFNYYADQAPQSCGRYKHGHKAGKWKYFNTQGKKVKVEKYSKDGTLVSTKVYDPPKKCMKTIFNPRHPLGSPYIIQ